jgi:hypothetical protein
MNIDAEKMMELAEIRHGKFVLQGRYDGTEQGGCVSYQNNVNDIQKQIGCLRGLVENKKGRITLGGNKTEREQKCGETVEPSARRLFEAVQRFVKPTNMRRKSGIGKNRRVVGNRLFPGDYRARKRS